MTRKRFIKLLMAEDVSRNRAQAIAWVVNRSGQPYHEALPATRALLRLKVSSARIGQAFQRVGASITRLGEAVALHVMTFKEAAASLGLPSPEDHPDGLRTDVAIVDEWDGWQHAAIRDKAMAGRPPSDQVQGGRK